MKFHKNIKKLVYGTLDIAVFDEGTLTVTTLGDSPAYYFNGVEARRVARNQKKYEWMIDAGYITREQYQGYISQMHEMMQCCFDFFIPEVVPNNIIEQYKVLPNDTLVFCSDGMSDWVSKDKIFKTLAKCDLEDGINKLIVEAKEVSVGTQNYSDDITAIAVK